MSPEDKKLQRLEQRYHVNVPLTKSVFLLLPGFLNARYFFFLIYIWQHRFTLQFATYRSSL
jgi:hypothetical protein